MGISVTWWKTKYIVGDKVKKVGDPSKGFVVAVEIDPRGAVRYAVEFKPALADYTYLCLQPFCLQPSQQATVRAVNWIEQEKIRRAK